MKQSFTAPLILSFEGHEPSKNLQAEEELLKISSAKAIIHFYINSPCVVMGRNNKEEEWVYLDEVRRANIPLLRRITGGGTVYHDLRTLNFGYILDRALLKWLNRRKLHIMDFFRRLIINSFADGGIKLKESGRADIQLNGRKVIGCACAIRKNRILFHASALFEVDYASMQRFLPIPKNRHPALTHEKFVTSFNQEKVLITMDDAKTLLIKGFIRLLQDSH